VNLPPAVYLTVLDFDPTELARQLTLCEHELYLRIQPKELLDQAWQGRDKEHKAPGLVAMMVWSTRITRWAVTEILRGESAKARAAVYERYVAIAKVRLCDIAPTPLCVCRYVCLCVCVCVCAYAAVSVHRPTPLSHGLATSAARRLSMCSAHSRTLPLTITLFHAGAGEPAQLQWHGGDSERAAGDAHLPAAAYPAGTRASGPTVPSIHPTLYQPNLHSL
jgi:hypothetical protein